VKDNVFGANPQFAGDEFINDGMEDEMYSLSLDFKDFPFVEEHVARYRDNVAGTRFEDRGVIRDTGTRSIVCYGIYCSLYHLIISNFIC
jgi:hypothetical protein